MAELEKGQIAYTYDFESGRLLALVVRYQRTSDTTHVRTGDVYAKGVKSSVDQMPEGRRDLLRNPRYYRGDLVGSTEEEALSKAALYALNQRRLWEERLARVYDDEARLVNMMQEVAL